MASLKQKIEEAELEAKRLKDRIKQIKVRESIQPSATFGCGAGKECRPDR